MFLTLQIARNRLHLLFAWLSECMACPGCLTGPGWSLTSRSRSLFLFVFSWLFCCGFNSVSIILSLLWLVSCWVLWDRHKSSRIRNDVKIKCLLKLLHYLCWASLFFFWVFFCGKTLNRHVENTWSDMKLALLLLSIFLITKQPKWEKYW